MGLVCSLNVGGSEPNPLGRGRPTGIHKHSVESVEVRAPGPKRGGAGSGLVGDFVGDQRHHGGDHQAVYAYAREELDRWEERLDRELADGSFGENLTTVGLDVDGAIIGERWRVGEHVVLQVCGPRIPCHTFRARMGVRGWIRTFTEAGNPGAYLSVTCPGTIRAGDRIDVEARPGHGIDVRLVFAAFTGDAAAADEVLAARVLHELEHDELAVRVARRTARTSAPGP